MQALRPRAGLLSQGIHQERSMIYMLRGGGVREMGLKDGFHPVPISGQHDLRGEYK